MKKLFHNILCTVSRRYRAAHCQHVDELPPRMSRRLRDECRKMDPRTWNSARDMMDDLLRECRESVMIDIPSVQMV